MHFANRHTLGAIFARDLMNKDAINRRRKSIIDMVIGYLTDKALGDRHRCLISMAQLTVRPIAL